jgi:D-tyrosyl-tRNA(Tyr) deacylase
MRIVVQRVKEASVSVAGKNIGAIGKGLLLLVGVAHGDTHETACQMALKISRMRIFEDNAGKMNLDVTEAGGKILSVPQFTLLADTSKGNRPGFDGAAAPQDAEIIWKVFNDAARMSGIDVAEGAFGAHMEVTLVNDGPVTFIVDSKLGGSR